MKIKESNLKFRFPLEKRKRTDLLILHHSGSSFEHSHDIHEIHKSHLMRDKETWAGFGYHYFVSKSGEVFRGRPIDTIGANNSNDNII